MRFGQNRKADRLNPFKILKQLIPYVIEIIVVPFLLPWVLANQARANVIQRVAADIAAQLVVEFPAAEWAVLVDLAVRRLVEALPDGARTENMDVIRRAAEAALKREAPNRAPAVAPFPSAPAK